jgi:single-strand DNA-binding protein
LDTWDDKQTGQKRSKLRVVCENFQMLGSRDGGGEGGGGGRSSGGRSPAKSAPADEPSDDDIPF